MCVIHLHNEIEKDNRVFEQNFFDIHFKTRVENIIIIKQNYFINRSKNNHT